MFPIKRVVILCAAFGSLQMATPTVAARHPVWRLGPDREATAVIVNRGADPAWVKLHLLPRGRAGVVSPPLRVRPGQRMAFNLRYFLPDVGRTDLRGRLKVRHASPGDRVEVSLLREEIWGGGLYQMGSQLAESPEEVFDPCDDPDACDEGDPLYVRYDHFEYEEWDLDGDGITDPHQRSALVIYDSNGNITWADSIAGPLFPSVINPPLHDWFCAEQVQGSCIKQRCSIVEYVDSVETGRTLIGSDFLEITFCPDQEPTVEVFEEDVSLAGPELFYRGCLQSASLRFNSVMDEEILKAKQELVDMLRELLGIGSAASGITIGGILKDGPFKVAGKFIRRFPAARLVWDELRAIDRGHEAQLFLREQACAWVTAERLCYEKTEEIFGPVEFQRRDVYKILDAKNIATDIVRRHCRQP